MTNIIIEINSEELVETNFIQNKIIKFSENDSINNPLTGTPSFGVFPYIKHKLYEFPKGEIYLRYGRHIGANRGFGLIHIWKEHFKEITNTHDAIIDIGKFVSSIISENAKIYCEDFSSRKRPRTTIFKSKKGLVILEERRDGKNNCYYAVVTAYSGNAKGSQIGAL
jgi:hypothetical protein